MMRLLAAVLLLALMPDIAFAQASVTTVPLLWPTTNKSGTVTTGGTFQQVDGASTTRKAFEFGNTNAAHTCYVFFGSGSATTATALPVTAGTFRIWDQNVVPNDVIQVTCASTNDTFYAAVRE